MKRNFHDSFVDVDLPVDKEVAKALIILRRQKFLMYLTNCTVLLFFLVLPQVLHAKPLQKALVRKAINEVFVYEDVTQKSPDPRPARPGKDILRGQMALETHRQSRAELLFVDGSVARIGSNALFSFTEEARTLQLGKGVMLFQVPKNSESTTIRTSAASAALTGTTVFFEQQPGNYVKMIVMEGNVTVSIPERLGEQLELTAGQMIAMPTEAQRLPDPVYVDLEQLANSSGLIEDIDAEDGDGEFNDVSFTPEQYEDEIQDQEEQIEEGAYESTNMTIQGEGMEVIFDDEKENEELTRNGTREGSRVEAEGALSEITGDQRIVNGIDNTLRNYYQPVTIDGQTTLNLASLHTDQFPPILENEGSLYEGGIYSSLSLDQSPSEWYSFTSLGTSAPDLSGLFGFNSDFKTLTANRNVSSLKFNSITISGDPNIETSQTQTVTDLALVASGAIDATADGTFGTLDSLTLLGADNVDVSGNLLSHNGADLGLYSLRGDVTVDNVSMPSGESGNNARLFARSGGLLTVTGSNQANEFSLKAENGITVNSSAEISALANASEAEIAMLSRNLDGDNSDVDLEVKGTLKTQNGSVSLVQSGGGKILLDSNQLLPTSETTDHFLAEVTGPGGEIEITGGTRLDADQTLKLLASPSTSSGLIEFTGNDDIYLSGSAHKTLKADDINVSNSLDVEVTGGNLTIYTNDNTDISTSSWDEKKGTTGGNGGDIDSLDSNMTIIIRKLETGERY